MKKLSLVISGVFALTALSALASISVGPGGSAVETFSATPALTEWAVTTAGWTGAPGDITTAGALDTQVNTNVEAFISTIMGTSGTWPPSANARFRRNTAANLLAVRPNNTTKAALLKATLQNDTGRDLNSLTISYDMGAYNTVAEEIPGLRVYYSFTGAAGSWTVIPALCSGTPGHLTTAVALSSTWTNLSTLFLLWADDDGSANPDGSYTIDNFVASPALPITLPATSWGVDSATLNGQANPDGRAATAWFEYGTSTGYGSTTTSESIGSGSSYVTLTPVPLTGLALASTYHYRVASMDTASSVVLYGPDVIFRTIAAPEIANNTVAAPVNSVVSATLDDHGLPTTVKVYWGSTDGGTTPGSWDHVVDIGVQAQGIVKQRLPGLTLGNTYYFRYFASNSQAPAGVWAPTTESFVPTSTLPVTADLLFAATTDSFPPSGNLVNWTNEWPSASEFVRVAGTPTVKSFGGVKWEKNLSASADCFQLRDPAMAGTTPAYSYQDPIPANGATIIVAMKPLPRIPSDNWDSIVDIFYDRLVLGMRNDTGFINVRRNGSADIGTVAIPVGQSTILSLVVQPTGEYKVYANGTEVMNSVVTSDMTALVPGPLAHTRNMNIGRNNPDGWPCFNGYIGDAFAYTTALSDSDRLAMEAALTKKFITDATLSYTITASAGPNGTISPSGVSTIVQGYDLTNTITANTGYVIDTILVDGSPVALANSYVFSDISANHIIDVTFKSVPDQVITATADANGTISPIGSVSVPAGADATFNMLPNSGYRIASVVVDGVTNSNIASYTNSSYTFKFVLAPHTINVTFAAISMNIPKTDQLIFSAVTDSLPDDGLPTGNWPSYVPSGQTLAVIGTGVPTVQVIDGVKWELNNSATSDAFRYGSSYWDGSGQHPIPCSGATIIVAIRPGYRVPSDNWDSVVDIFYDRLVLGMRNDTGLVNVWRNGSLTFNTIPIPENQNTILSLVVQPTGEYKVFANGSEIMNIATLSDMTSLVPGVVGSGANGFGTFVNVGRNNPDGWPCFNGNIGDVFVYRTALSTAERQQVENILVPKFKVLVPPQLPPSGVKVTGGVPSITFPTTAGLKYRLLYEDDLTVGFWQPVINDPNFPLPDGWSAVSTGAPMIITDTSAAGQSQRFYKLEPAYP